MIFFFVCVSDICFDLAGCERARESLLFGEGAWDDDEKVDLSFAKGPSFLYPVIITTSLAIYAP